MPWEFTDARPTETPPSRRAHHRLARGTRSQDHFYRHLEAKLDLSFVREWARELYAERGRPSIDPVVFFKLQLILFFEGSRSERQLMQMASLTGAFAGTSATPWTRTCPTTPASPASGERLGRTSSVASSAIVDLCQEAGLVWGKELYFDATKVEANASLDSVAPRFAVEAHLGALFASAEMPEDWR